MKIGILLTARLGSSRLKKKHLLEVSGQPILSYLIQRISAAFCKEIGENKIEVVIVTSDESENRQFESLVSSGLTVFYGSIQNIPLRHLQAAEEYNFDAIISVDGDDILCSVEGMRRVYQALSDGKKFVKTAGLPFGINVSGYSKDFLQSSLHDSKDAILETGWGRIFDEASLAIIDLSLPIQHEHMRFTLDYPEDFSFFQELITRFPGDLERCTDSEVVDFVEKEKLYEITKPAADRYWDNFNSGVELERRDEEK
jgi:spore coat polysaccharide biosynthesis protein SpsF (cytidylyltransferase family)